MTIKVLFADPTEWLDYRPHLQVAFARAGLDVFLSDTIDEPADIDYIVTAPSSQLQDFTPFCNLKAVLNLWAGVEGITDNPTLKVPLARMVEPGMTQGMVEWVLGHVMRHHLETDRHVLHQDGEWRHNFVPPLAAQRRVTVLGLGALGTAVADRLHSVGFDVCGWSRSSKPGADYPCYTGQEQISEALQSAEILVLLVPQTPRTQNLINAQTLALMPKNAVIINPGRGGLIDDNALLAALDSGHISHATLDVFEVEPLPKNHRFWAHPHVTVTPHVASSTRPEFAAETIAENVKRGESGAPYLHLVDRARGY